MPGYWDYDDGNGNYDVTTREDYERWEDEKAEDDRRRKYDEATEEELKDPYFDVPY